MSFTFFTTSLILFGNFLLPQISSTKLIDLSTSARNAVSIVASEAHAELGKPYSLNCSVNIAAYHQPPTIRWHLPINENITFINTSVTLHDELNGKIVQTLLITLASKPRKQILLRCSSRSSVKSDLLSLHVAHYRLSVNYRPQLLLTTEQWEYGIGGNANLSCTFDSQPTANVQWYRNGHLVTPEVDRICTSQSNCKSVEFSCNETYTLTIATVIYSDYGEYTCVAINSMGYNIKNGSFQIELKYGELGHTCLSNADCTERFSFCSDEMKCSCRQGYVPEILDKKPEERNESSHQSIDLMSRCIRAAKLTEICESTTDCVDVGSSCNETTFTCQCSANHAAVNVPSIGIKCFPRQYELFATCFHNSQCMLPGTTCDGGHCFCDDYHKYDLKSSNSEEPCIQKAFLYTECSESDACERGGFAHSKCAKGICICKDGYFYNKQSHHCEDQTIASAFLIPATFLFLIGIFSTRNLQLWFNSALAVTRNWVKTNLPTAINEFYTVKNINPKQLTEHSSTQLE